MRTPRPFKAFVAQISPRLGDISANLEIHREHTARARECGAEVVVFPELSLTGYLLRDMVPVVALRLDSAEMAALRAESRKIAIVCGFVEETPSFRFYNSALFLDRGEIQFVHRKIYLPTYGMFDEHRDFARGKRLCAFDTRLGRAAILICEDAWHLSLPYLAALDRADFFFVLAASPFRGFRENCPQDDVARYWELLLRFHAQTFSTPVVFCNRIGFEDGIGFWGGSEILDARGNRVRKAAYYEPDGIVGAVNTQVGRKQRKESPYLAGEDLDLTLSELRRIRDRPTSSDIP